MACNLVADFDADATEVVGNDETRRLDHLTLENVATRKELELRVKGNPFMHIRVDTECARN
jgi:hypothetical protein